ncbi:ribonuclease VapC1 [Methanobrevibacter cuticularis]|uniref:Ribonuclease VapC1 n=1 Tax=Methanobrevibacter cuticularis TaxID=47311 RepID=A0A166E1J7_9EURY|nr:type II toxin-antitoxin system VapC family toxin [Methanobrevibacter cuticularis]KZX16174.1 ribonuclease VapC1 [Methanobrevibacter cuticularis]
MIFLDTDILINYFKGNKNIQSALLKHLQNGEDICTTTLNVYEIVKGFKYIGSEKKIKKLETFLNEIEVFNLNNQSMVEAAEIFTNLKKAGKTIGDMDILIATIVMQNNGILVSNNTRHFKNIQELQLTNWM